MNARSNDMINLFCRNCEVVFQKFPDSYKCISCGAELKIESKIIRFPSSSLVPDSDFQKVMYSYLNEIRKLGWEEALYSFQQRNPPDLVEGIVSEVLLPSRAGWKFLLPISKDAKVLDLGSRSGESPISMARSCSHVTAVDIEEEFLELLIQAASYEGVRNISFIHAREELVLPFMENYFDIVVVNGLMDLIPDVCHGDPELAQLKFLQELNRVLHPNGTLYIADRNRYSYTHLVRSVEKKYSRIKTVFQGSLKMNDSRSLSKYAFSNSGYKRIFMKAGFKVLDCYALLPDMNNPAQIVDLEHTGQMSFEALPNDNWKLRIKNSITFLRRFAPSFSHILASQHQQHRSPGFLNLVLTKLREQNGMEELICEKYVVRHLGVLAFCRSKINEDFSCVIRLPFSEKGRRRVQGNMKALITLGSEEFHCGSNKIQIPAVLYEGEILGQYFGVESWIPGIDFSESRCDFHLISHQLNSFLIQLGKISLKENLSSSEVFSQNLKHKIPDISGKILDEKWKKPFEQIARALLEKLEELQLPSIWIHGDFHLGNCILKEDKPELVGVVDWDQMSKSGLPGLDLLNVLSRRRIERGQTWTIALNHLAEGQWENEEKELWNTYFSELGISKKDHEILVWTLWLKVFWEGIQVNQYLNYNWMNENVYPVINRLKSTFIR